MGREKNTTIMQHSFGFWQIYPHCENCPTTLTSYFQVHFDLIRNLQRTFKEKRIY